MKKVSRYYFIFSALALLLLFSGCRSSQKNSKTSKTGFTPEAYTALYADKWSAINDSVKAGWKNHSGKPSNNAVPDTFAYAFNEWTLFYWDLYFTQIGLLKHNELKLAKGGINNLKAELDKRGFIPNANTDWGDNRSQPPYFGIMVKEFYDFTKDKKWLKTMYAAVLKEYKFWTDTSANRIEANTTELGLQRYFHHATETELLELYDQELTSRFDFPKDIEKSKKLNIASQFAAEAESGMDFTPRFENRCSEFIAVDLNSNLYLYEKYLAYFEQELKIGNGQQWLAKARKRKALIQKYCWNDERGLFLDYDFVNNRSSKVAAATAFSPLFAGLASKYQADRMRENLHLFESENGIVACESTDEKRIYQWDHISVWSPMQSLVIMALDNYGFKEDACRIAMKHLDLITANFFNPNPSTYVDKSGKKFYRLPGGIYEKYTRFGTINDREYNASLMYGWSAGAFAFAYDYLIVNSQHNFTIK
ncbi:MAG TPA: trehalase family glycosidase [Paludibacteraceae bacterium]|nr:trehalase family glycosidase [Paludibacteraceae bacterium]HOL30023.1 trehalase family glycosidase [Paludibacteraceae bacterium]HON01614.1 trehalase family glycosidase [Paludibacteraceae bacterium]HPD59589.1 trehalase family glycosidase [Paludibacteraceae bacterium]HPQ11879.1 trehalase family glycosidase [Paludibacteraceae bacterium]